LNLYFLKETGLILVLAHLFVKVPGPGDIEITFSVFRSSCHLLLPVSTTHR